MSQRFRLMASKFFLIGLCAAGLASCVSNDQGANGAATSSTMVVSSDPNAPDGAIVATPMVSAPLDETKTLSRIVFASCAQQLEDQSIWDVIAGEKPDLTLYFGDNVYGDVRSNDPALPELKAAYMRLAQSEPFGRARAVAPMLTTWDDHDYGMNDAGGGYRYKEQSEALYEYVWDVDDERAARPGVYGSWIIGEDGKRVQIIMLDTRFFRSDLMPTDEFGKPGKERYVPSDDPTLTMLGEAQWQWLGGELQKSADLRLLVSSVQVISEGHGWEAWKMLPRERERLYSLLGEAGARKTLILSGDRHSAALYRKDGVADHPVFEATSSSLNLPLRGFLPDEVDYVQEPGPNRLTDMYIDANYGVLEIDWDASVVAVSIRNDAGDPVMSETVSFR